MKLIKLACPNCGATLNVNSDEKTYTCQYCRANIILDDETIRIEHLIKDSSKEENLKKAITYLEDLEEYDKAFAIFERLAELYPYDASIWFYLVQTLTENFSNYTLDSKGLPNVQKSSCDYYFEKYLKVEKNKITKEKNAKKYFSYLNELSKLSDDKIFELKEIERKEIEKNDKIVKFFGIFLIASLIIGFIVSTFLTEYEKREAEKYKWSAEVFFNDSKEYEYELSTISQDSLIVAHIKTNGGRKDEEIKLYYVIEVNGKFIGQNDFSFIWEDNETGIVYFDEGKYDYGLGELSIEIYTSDDRTCIGKSTIKVVE